MLFAIVAGQLCYQRGVILGFILTILGLMLVVNPTMFDLEYLGQVLQANPIAYGFAVIVVGGLIGWAYYQWNQSLHFGNMKILILATYFMLIWSSFMSMLILKLTVEWMFWLGTAFVTLGALIYWKSTKEINQENVSKTLIQVFDTPIRCLFFLKNGR